MKTTNRIVSLAGIAIVLVTFLFFITSTASILKPIVFATMISITLLPIQRWFEKRFSVVLSTILTLLSSIIPILLAGTFVYFQLANVIKDLPNVGKKLNSGLSKLSAWIKSSLPESLKPAVDDISLKTGEFVSAGAEYIGTGLTGTLEIIGSIFLCGLIVFFLLLYRVTIKEFVLIQFTPEQRSKARTIARRVRKMLSSYLSGLLTVIFLIGILNSIGLLIIGIDYAVFWGFLAAFLTIIPYVGTTIGGSLPFLYALATADYTWQPIAVLVLYGAIQQLEGNIITPKIVGDKVKINPLVAIVGLLFGALIWGVAGIILSIPILAIIRIIFNQVDPLKPAAILMSSEISEKAGTVITKYDNDRYRLSRLISSKKQPSHKENKEKNKSEDIMENKTNT